MTKYISLIIAVLFSYSLSGQQILSQQSDDTVFDQYALHEFVITTTGSFSNPFDSREVMLDMILNSPSGKEFVLPCFFEKANGKTNVWRARLMLQEAGAYQYRFRLTLKGKKGNVTKRFTLNSRPSGKDGILHIGDYWTFRFDSGKPFRGIGENVGWEARSFENKKWTYDYLLPTLSANGANFFRSWMCPWNLPVAWKKISSTNRYANSDSYFNESGIKRMDELVEMCDSLGLYFMVSIDAHGSLIPDGGWKGNSHNILNGGPAATPQEFFTNSESKAMYKNRLRYLIARWGYSPAIAAWEFFNEIDNAVFTPTPHDSVLIDHRIITQWHDEMSTYVKQNDPYKHIVTTSISHRDITGMNDLVNIDLNQKHIYNKTHLIVPTIHDYIARYKKPYVIGEFGYDWNWDNVKHVYGTNFEFDYKRGLWYGLFSPTPILPMTWWWEFFDERKMTPYFRNVRTINDMMLQAGGGSFENVDVESGALETLAVKCGASYFVYALNPGNARDAGSVKIKAGGSSSYQVKVYNPSEGIFSEQAPVKSTEGIIMVDAGVFNVHEDRIFIFTSDTSLSRKTE
ncbi:MAG TPA: cellulase family glycosylhydrolase [Ohtaekwangia sp.]